jgi:FkbH-like protein
VLAGLAIEGWTGFSLLRRYLAVPQDPPRALAQRIRSSVPWEGRGDLEARTVRFAFLADSLTTNLQDPLVLECLARGIVPHQYHARAGHISREIRDPASGLWAEERDVVVVAVSPSRNVETARIGSADRPFADAFLDGLLEDLRILRDKCGAVLLVHNFLPPEFRVFGLHDWRERGGVGESYARLNLALAERCRELPDVYVVDLGLLVALSGARWWSVHKTWFLGTFSLPDDLAPLLCREYAAAGAARRGLLRKCLVLDLDDTLWGGVVGEVGAAEIQIGGGYPGNIYQEIQRIVRQLHEGGLILAINSRNDEEDAWRPFEARTEMVLRRKDFSAWRINWQDKAANLRELAQELSLGLDSMVVLDNDPVTSSWIEQRLPEVHVLPARDPLDMVRVLATSRLFADLSRTAEDLIRGRSQAAVRRKEQSAAIDRETFLADLNLVVTVGRASSDQLPRLVQLSQRSNQFNLTTRRYTHAQLEELSRRLDSEVLYCACRERFADEGITGLVTVRKQGAEWTMDTLALSCRVLGWGVERALVAAVCLIATDAGATGLEGQYIPTLRNRQTEWFYRDLGFSLVRTSDAGSAWRLALPPEEDLNPGWISLHIAPAAR